MLGIVPSATLLGIEGHTVIVEVHISSGLPSFAVVGSPDSSCREASGRVRAAMLSSGCTWPMQRVTVNLAPPSVRKIGAGLDLAIAIAILVASEQLPQREQEQLETVVGLVAVAMITWMVVWVHRHAATLKQDLELRADVALVAGSGLALAVMAFLAVLREGLETAVFLLAAFDASTNPELTGTGAALGVLVAVILDQSVHLVQQKRRIKAAGAAAETKESPPAASHVTNTGAAPPPNP